MNNAAGSRLRGGIVLGISNIANPFHHPEQAPDETPESPERPPGTALHRGACSTGVRCRRFWGIAPEASPGVALVHG